jgi:hypothetical protein
MSTAASRNEGHGQRGGLDKVSPGDAGTVHNLWLVTDRFGWILNGISHMKSADAVPRFDDNAFPAGQLEFKTIP